MGFIFFKNGEIAKKMLDTKWLESQIRSNVNSQEARSLGVESLVVTKSYVESDIIWDNLKKN